MNKDFLKDVLVGKKDLLRKAVVVTVMVPHYDELSVRRLWPDLKKDPDFVKYFPSVYPKDKGPPREYFFNVLNTVHPEYLEQLMTHANKQRMSASGESQQKETIKISQFWEEELKAMPYLSRKYKSYPKTLILILEK